MQINVKVIVFPDIRDKIPSSRQGNVKQLCPKLLANIKIPIGYTIHGERKFIVMKNETDILVAIGPLRMNNTYHHRDIVASVHGTADSNLLISGGGSISFNYSSNKWSAKFRGRSGDFGVYDPIILDPAIQLIISNALGMATTFKRNS